ESTASSRISQYENGYSVPSYQLMQKIASILQIPTCYFYCDDEELADYLINYYRR
ncbi:helix-turn-helix transcriptional regulator, partial [Salmonella enterica]|nr:helix-turn-helix transcriptional regulator [Salmonella enterica]